MGAVQTSQGCRPFMSTLRLVDGVSWRAPRAWWGFIKRKSEMTHFANYNADLVEGLRLQLLNVERNL
jgi:hypothetical protein